MTSVTVEESVMPLRVALAALLLFVLVGGVDAQQQRSDSPFDRWDANGDGKLTKEELPARVRGNFGRVDADGDGFISREEDRAFRNRGARAGGNRRQPRIPDSIQLLSDLPYAGSDNPRQTLDLLLPKQRVSADPLPVVVFIHGGGWRNGDKNGGRGTLLPYVAGGEYAGVSVGYRLTDEASWPAQIHDCKAAIRWIRAHAEEHQLDPDRIGVMGSSAGGHLVSMLGVSGGLEDLEGHLGENDGQSSRVTCVVNMYGPSELLRMNDFPGRLDHDAPRSPESQLVGGPLQERAEVARSASPVTHVTADDAPFLHVHGSDDPVVAFDQAQRLHAALQKAGVPSLLLKVEGGEHGGFRSEEVNRRIRQFFERHLRGREVTISEEPILQGASSE